MNDTPQTIKHINVRVVEESPVPWEELFGYMPEITDGLPVADYLEGIRGEEPRRRASESHLSHQETEGKPS